ncbi:MAG: hypothetical protein ACJ8C4_06765 [Gemmataceae bacterium]
MLRDLVVKIDFCSVTIVAVIAHIVARTTARFYPRCEKAMGWSAVLTLLLTCTCGFAEIRPDRPAEILGIIVVGWILAAAVALAVAIVFSPIAWLCDRGRNLVNDWRDLRRQAAIARQEKIEQEQRRIERELTLARIREEESRRPPPAPAPTQDELAQACRRRHEERCRLARVAGLTGYELEAAIERSQQKYLNELDAILK